VVAEIAHRVVVMYAGRKVEEAPIGELFASPRHPYTRGLLGSMPHLGDSVNETGKRLVEIPGMVPSLKDPAPGCLFAPRCPNAIERCARDAPPLELHAPGHGAACWNPVAAPRSAASTVEAA
jgi:peptide/nickel transport system ATP-binding protein